MLTQEYADRISRMLHQCSRHYAGVDGPTIKLDLVYVVDKITDDLRITNRQDVDMKRERIVD